MKLEHKTVERQLAWLTEHLREHGLKITQQRLVIYRALLESDGHLTAEQVHTAVAPQNPSLSVSTVYNVLETLVEINAITELTTESGTRLFDRTVAPHHHFVDLDTGEVVDLDLAGVNLDLAGLKGQGFEVERTKLTIYGRRKGKRR